MIGLVFKNRFAEHIAVSIDITELDVTRTGLDTRVVLTVNDADLVLGWL